MTDRRDDGPRYEWQSNGGCERCDALDGHLCREPPPRPHESCDCRILYRSRSARTCDSSDVRYEVEHVGNVHHEGVPTPDDHFELVFDYTIQCWGNAAVISGEVLVQRRYVDLEGDVDELIEEAYDEALQKIESIAVSECPVCGHHPHVA